MFFRLLLESFRRQRRRKLLAGIAIVLGTTAVTAMLALATTIGDRIHAELAVYGANIVVTPAAQNLAVNLGATNIHPALGNTYLHESDLAKLNGIFWANNITAISPELSLTVGVRQRRDLEDPMRQHALVNAVGLWFRPTAGGKDAALSSSSMRSTAPSFHPLWTVRGRWPTAPDEIAIGRNLEEKLRLRLGDPLDIIDQSSRAGETTDLEGHRFSRAVHAATSVGASVPEVRSARPFHITGIVTTGDLRDDQLLLPLASAQALKNTPDAIDRVEVSARTKPEDAFARRDPDTMSPADHDRWYCRPYANSIAYQIREAIPNADAQQVRRVEQSEGNVLRRISGLMWLIAGAAALAAGFAVAAAMATAVLERRAEIGLMRSLGAGVGRIALLFYTEAALLALAAGTVGYLVGSALAALLGAHIFGEPGITGGAAAHLDLILNPVLIPIALGLALLVALAGSTPAIRSALRLDPSAILRNGA